MFFSATQDKAKYYVILDMMIMYVFLNIHSTFQKISTMNNANISKRGGILTVYTSALAISMC